MDDTESSLHPSARALLAWALAGLVLLAASAAGVYYSLRTSDAGTAPGASGANSPIVDRPASERRVVPDLKFQDAEGKPLTLSDFRGKSVLVNIWATWCVPCREEMPALDRLQQKLAGPGFEVLALSIDTGGVKAIRPFFADVGIRSLAIYADPSMEATNKLRVVGVPTTVLVDPKGRERWRKVGPAQWDSDQMVQLLRAQLREKESNGN